MTPHELLQHSDSGALWSAPASAEAGFYLPAAYQCALALRQLRVARGEQPRGYKIGFTNRNIWPRYGVYAPIWGTVYDSTLTFCDGKGVVSLAHTCQPRIEPELVFGMKATPAADASLEQLFAAQVSLLKAGQVVDQGCGANVLDGPLHALQHFLLALRTCPGAPDLRPGDVITTGTWTDAWPVQGGQRWSAAFSGPLSPLEVEFHPA